MPIRLSIPHYKVLKDQQATARERVRRVYDYAGELVTIAETRMRELAKSLGVQLRELTPLNQSFYRAYWNSARNDSPKKHYFYNQILEVAQKFHYFANFDRYRAWIRLSIKTQEHFEFIVSIHCYGHHDTGVMAASAFTDRCVEKEEGAPNPSRYNRRRWTCFNSIMPNHWTTQRSVFSTGSSAPWQLAWANGNGLYRPDTFAGSHAPAWERYRVAPACRMGKASARQNAPKFRSGYKGLRTAITYRILKA